MYVHKIRTFYKMKIFVYNQNTQKSRWALEEKENIFHREIMPL
jgi:hypothetical protein